MAVSAAGAADPPAFRVTATVVLREISVSQATGEPRRRWFADDYFDLIVWFSDDGRISGFQLCYDKGRDEHALTCDSDGTMLHHRIDGGERRPSRNDAPILVVTKALPKASLLQEFMRSSGSLDRTIVSYVRERLGRDEA